MSQQTTGEQNLRLTSNIRRGDRINNPHKDMRRPEKVHGPTTDTRRYLDMEDIFYGDPDDTTRYEIDIDGGICTDYDSWMPTQEEIDHDMSDREEDAYRQYLDSVFIGDKVIFIDAAGGDHRGIVKEIFRPTGATSGFKVLTKDEDLINVFLDCSDSRKRKLPYVIF